MSRVISIKMKSKFESCLTDIQRTFRGPYPLDQVILENFVPRSPGIYVWYQPLNGRNLGYVGRSTKLLNRLKTWASELDGGMFYFRLIDLSILNKTEEKWIIKAGDLNKI